jgi:signal transduction histidine kinase
LYEELIEDGYEIPLIIADYIMPEMTGDMLLESIYQKDKYIKTILLTGQASIQGVENAVNKANLYRYISKPWEKDDLTLTVREAIRSYLQEKTIKNQYEELKELNASLEEKVKLRTKELQDLNNTKDKFFSIIAHDLKNPFNTLLGFSDLLRSNYNDFDDNKRKEFIDILHITSQNGFSLLENLLEWSRSQTGRIKFEPEKLDLRLLLEEIITMIKSSAIKKNIDITNNISNNASSLLADENMVRTILRNLLSNAIKFTPSNGSVEINSQHSEGFIEISVKDSGVGMSEKEKNSLLRIDVNQSKKGTDNEEGTGLGLILCKEFVEKHGGKIWVKSEEGEGSTFTFSIPEQK